MSPGYFAWPTGLFFWICLPFQLLPTSPWSQTSVRLRGLSQPCRGSLVFLWIMSDIRSPLGLFRPSCIQNFFFLIWLYLRIIWKKKSNLNILLGHQSSGLDGLMMDENLFSLVIRMWLGAEDRWVEKLVMCMFVPQNPVSSGRCRIRATPREEGRHTVAEGPEKLPWKM